MGLIFMADKLSDIIKQQMEDLRRNAPKPLDQAERSQIMLGRKSQKDIDAGRAAIDARAKELDNFNKALGALNDKLVGAVGDENKAAGVASEEAKRQAKEAASNPLMDRALPAAGGAVGGGLLAYGVNSKINQLEKGNTQALAEIARELGPTSKLTDSRLNRARAVGAANAAERFAPSSKLAKAMGVGSRAVAYGLPAGVIFNEYHRYDDLANDPNESEANKNMNRKIANAILGVGTGIAAEGAARAVIPSRAQGQGQALARVETARELARRFDDRDASKAEPARTSTPLSRALTGQTIDAEAVPVERTKALPSPAPAPVEAPEAAVEAGKAATPGTKAYMVKQAKDLGVKGASKMAKPQLADALARALSEHGSKRTRVPKLPGGSGTAALAGALAYGMSPDQAEAADGTGVGQQAAALTNAGVAGGTAYGTKRLVDALKPAVGQAASMASEALAPANIDAMTDYSPDDLAMGRNALARNLPSALQFGAVADAREMAQVPERAPRPVEAAPAPADQAAAPEPTDFDSLVRASQDDPELAALLRQAVMARIGGEQLGALPEVPEAAPAAARPDPMVSMLRNVGAR